MHLPKILLWKGLLRFTKTFGHMVVLYEWYEQAELKLIPYLSPSGEEFIEGNVVVFTRKKK